MPHSRSWTGTSFTVRDCPIARARLSSGDSRTVGSFGSSSVRSIPTGSREIFVTTALTRALSRRASSSSTDSDDVPSPTWDYSRGARVPARLRAGLDSCPPRYRRPVGQRPPFMTFHAKRQLFPPPPALLGPRSHVRRLLPCRRLLDGPAVAVGVGEEAETPPREILNLRDLDAACT